MLSVFINRNTRIRCIFFFTTYDFIFGSQEKICFFFFRMETNVFWQSCETMIFIFFFFFGAQSCDYLVGVNYSSFVSTCTPLDLYILEGVFYRSSVSCWIDDCYVSVCCIYHPHEIVCWKHQDGGIFASLADLCGAAIGVTCVVVPPALWERVSATEGMPWAPSEIVSRDYEVMPSEKTLW